MNQKPTLIGWIIFLFVLYLLNQNRVIHKVFFYAALLILVFLVANNYKQIQNVMIQQGGTAQ